MLSRVMFQMSIFFILICGLYLGTRFIKRLVFISSYHTYIRKDIVGPSQEELRLYKSIKSKWNNSDIILKDYFGLSRYFSLSYLDTVHSIPPTPEEYLEYYRKVQLGQVHNKFKKRILCYKPNQAGLANRLNGLINTLLLAMITQREFYVCGWPALTSYFQFSIPIKIVPCDQLSFDHIYQFGVKCPLFTELIEGSFDELFPDSSILIITNCKLMFSYMRNKLFPQYMSYIGLPRESMKLNDYFLYLHHYFLSNILFPVDSIQQQIQSQRELLFTNPETYYIGLQIRTGDTIAFGMNETILLQNNTIVHSIMKNILKRSKQLNKQKIPFKWLLATDSSELKQQLIEHYPSFILIYNSQLEHSEKHTLSQYSQSTADAIIELYLLGSCQEIFTTPGSSYGGFAQCILGKGKLF